MAAKQLELYVGQFEVLQSSELAVKQFELSVDQSEAVVSFEFAVDFVDTLDIG